MEEVERILSSLNSILPYLERVRSHLLHEVSVKALRPLTTSHEENFANFLVQNKALSYRSL